MPREQCVYFLTRSYQSGPIKVDPISNCRNRVPTTNNTMYDDYGCNDVCLLLGAQFIATMDAIMYGFYK